MPNRSHKKTALGTVLSLFGAVLQVTGIWSGALATLLLLFQIFFSEPLPCTDFLFFAVWILACIGLTLGGAYVHRPEAEAGLNHVGWSLLSLAFVMLGLVLFGLVHFAWILLRASGPGF
jgi:hypothetical protein